MCNSMSALLIEENIQLHNRIAELEGAVKSYSIQSARDGCIAELVAALKEASLLQERTDHMLNSALSQLKLRREAESQEWK